MKNKLRLITDKLASNTRKLLLVDAIGAVSTATLLMIVAAFEAHFGMPQHIVYVLALVACLYGIYSFCCYFFVRTNPSPYLTLIAIANLLYCCISVVLVWYFYDQLSILGLSYFLLEVIIVTGLALWELKVSAKTTGRE